MQSSKQNRKNTKGGQAIITAVVFFLLLSMTMIIGIMTPLLRHLEVSHEFIRDKQSYYSAEALNEDILYRLNKTISVPSSVTLTLNGSTATATVNMLLGSSDQITTLGTFDSLDRELSMTVSQGVGQAFGYGMQAGNGGFTLQGGSTINGNVYSNADITSTNGSAITGTAIAANNGSTTSTIGGGTYVGAINIGTGSVGDAWAHTVSGASVAGTIYCQSGSNNNKSCDSSRGDPPAVNMPFATSTIVALEDEASSGGIISGNYTVGYSGATIGPKEITGNLTVSGGGTLTLTGTVWVKGTITVTGGGKVVLDPSYGSNSGALVADGNIDLNGGGSLTGSGQTGSYLLILTTSSSGSALSVTGGAGAVILVAQNGTATLSGGVNATQVTANTVSISGGSTVTYSSGLASLNFYSGPSGAWNVQNWQEVGQ